MYPRIHNVLIGTLIDQPGSTRLSVSTTDRKQIVSGVILDPRESCSSRPLSLSVFTDPHRSLRTPVSFHATIAVRTGHLYRPLFEMLVVFACHESLISTVLGTIHAATIPCTSCLNAKADTSRVPTTASQHVSLTPLKKVVRLAQSIEKHDHQVFFSEWQIDRVEMLRQSRVLFPAQRHIFPLSS